MNVLHTESGLNWGGQEYRTFDEIRWLNRHGHQSWLACDVRGESFKRGKNEVPLVGLTMGGSIDLKATLQVARFCKERNVDIIHNHGPRDAWISYWLHLAGYAVLRSRQIDLPVRPGFRRSFIYRHGCSTIIATSEKIRKDLIQDNEISPEKIKLVGEGVNFQKFNPQNDGASFRKEFGISGNAPLFGIVSMMRGEKGHHVFIDAAMQVLQAHPEARFVIVGEGVGGKRVEKECREKIARVFGENNMQRPIIMTGYRNDVPQIMAALDVLTVPSLKEAQTLVVPQAFASHCAVIASRVGGLPDLIEDEVNGLLVTPGETLELANAMKRLIDSVDLRIRLAAAGYRTAQTKLSFDDKMEYTVQLYREALESCKKRCYFSHHLLRSGLNLLSKNFSRAEFVHGVL